MRVDVPVVLSRFGRLWAARGKRAFGRLERLADRSLNNMVRARLASALEGVDRINFGCGDRFVEGWLNIGLFPEAEIPYGLVIARENGALVLNFDMSNELPIAGNTIRYIYASHFIEHLSLELGMRFIRDCYAMLTGGGIIRLTFPDMALWINKYGEGNVEFFEKYRRTYLRDGLVNTKGGIFMSQVHGFGHKWCYDFETMKEILAETGFSDVAKKNPFDSMIPEIRALEPGEEGRVMETAYVEARKRSTSAPDRQTERPRHDLP